MHVQLQRREVCWKFVSTHAAFGKGIYEKVETQVIKVYIHESSVIKSIKNIYYDTISCNEWIHPISQAHIIGRQRTSQDIMQYLLQASGHWAWGGSDGGMAFVPPKRPNLNAVQAPRCIHVMELRTINLRSCLCDAGCLLWIFFWGAQRICRWFDTVFLYSLLPNLCLLAGTSRGRSCNTAGTARATAFKPIQLHTVSDSQTTSCVWDLLSLLTGVALDEWFKPT